ncbi:MAG: thiamine pyrophosphate-dependent dehydrogenase E1 component subunit alpha [Candidatus Fimivivens sp.]
MNFTKAQMLKMYEDMVYTRVMGDKIVEFIFSGRIAGAIHPSLGQEAISAGIINAIANREDLDVYRMCTHRQQAILAQAVGLEPFLGELFTRASGQFGGVTGEYNFISLKDKILPMNGILGANLPTSTGFAWALKNEGKKGSVVLSSIGDGATSEGSVYEGLNLGALWQVPILYVIENNGYAISTPVSTQAAVKNLSERAAGMGLPGRTVDGNDIEAVTEAVMEGLEMAANNQPSVLELTTNRWQGHYVGDGQQYRDLEFLKNLDAIDPIKHYEKKLLERGVADQALFDRVHAEQGKLLGDAFDRAAEQPFPTKEMCINYDRMYATKTGGAL